MRLGETKSCGEKHKKAGSELRYALIGAQEPRKIGGRSTRRREPWGERRREPAIIGGTTVATLAYPRVTLQEV